MMLLLHSIFALFHTLPGKILFVGTMATDAVLSFLAVAEPASNRTLILLAIFGNVTVLIGVVFTGLVTLKSARISASNAKHLEVVAQLPAKVEKYTEDVNGKMTELMRLSREAEHAKGKEEERLEEIGRQGASALSKQQLGTPAPVTVENPPDDPANVKQSI